MDIHRKRIKQCWYNINYRCTNPKDRKYNNYGGKGIQNLLTKKELQQLWDRDNAASMEQPSIDRIDTAKHYSLENCRFIEMKYNRKKRGERKDLDSIIADEYPNKREWPGIHVRIEESSYQTLKNLARKDSRTVAGEATYLLQSAILNEVLKARG